MDKGISYLNRTFSDYKQALIDYSKKYYPDLAINYDDASVASWIIDLNADIADNLSYHIDRVYQETNIESAQENSSLYNIARTNGLKIPGPKGSMAELQIKCVLPVINNSPDWNYAPIIKRGTKVTSSSQQFEVLEDVDFSKQFNEDGYSDRTITPSYNSNGLITAYTITKLTVVTAGDTRVYRQTIASKDIKPFMEIIIPVKNVMNIESIIEVVGDTIQNTPSYGAFYSESESYCDGKFTRYFEVNNLAQTNRWGVSGGTGTRYEYGYNSTINGESITIPTYSICKGEWIPVSHKFMTEYTDKGYLKIIFGAGTSDASTTSTLLDGASGFAKYRIERIINNKNMGLLPTAGNTLFILYRVGGGTASNVAKGAINRITSLNIEMKGDDATTRASVKNSITISNTTPSISGKDMPTTEELKYLVKYHNAAQERCVTVKDYIDRILLLPPKYGTPFRVGVMEENNKIMVYLLGIDYQGKLDTSLPSILVKNIENYLSEYRMINDFIEIKSGRIINLSFDIDIIMDKNYNKSDVTSSIISVVQDYMDINRRNMGEEIYVGDLRKEISKVDGVLNLISLRVYNNYGSEYSSSKIGQEIITFNTVCDNDNFLEYEKENADLIDLDATDGILYNDGDSMMEIKYPDKDISIRVKER